MNGPRHINFVQVAMLMAMLVVVLGVYANALNNPFLIDDDNIITTHRDVIDNGGIVSLWGHDYWGD
jgi:hypothetical protein